MIEKSSSDSALGKLAELPIAGFSFGIDYSLIALHKNVFQIASDTLKNTPPEVVKSLLFDILNIFSGWKDEFGVYPPQAVGLFSLCNQKTPESAKHYCDRIYAEARETGKQVSVPEAWECCPFVQTPVGLFWKLFGEGYKPLERYLKEKGQHYADIIAILVILVDKPVTGWQIGECADAALKLLTYKIDSQKHQIKTFEPDARAAFYRRRNKRLKESAKKETTERMIWSVFQEYEKRGVQPRLKELAGEVGKSVSTVSRCLRKRGVKRYGVE